MVKLRRRENYYSELLDGLEYDRHLALLEVFNENQDVVRSEFYDEDGVMLRLEEREYRGVNLVEICVHDLEIDHVDKASYTYKGDLLVEEIEHFQHGEYYKRILKYDSEGRLTEIIKTDEKGTFLGRSTCIYESLNKIEKAYDDDGILYEEILTTYDADGNEVEIMEIEHFSEDFVNREIKTTTLGAYHDSKLVKQEVRRYGNLIFSAMNEYDSLGNLVKRIVENSEVDYVITSVAKYNTHGYLVSEIICHDEHEVLSKTLRYDLQGGVLETIETLVDEDGLSYTERIVCVNEYS